MHAGRKPNLKNAENAKCGWGFTVLTVALCGLWLVGCGSGAANEEQPAGKREPVLTATQRRVRVATLLSVANIRLSDVRNGRNRTKAGKLCVDEAVECLQLVINRYDETNFTAWLRLGEAYELAGRIEKAERAYEEAADLAARLKDGPWRNMPADKLADRLAKPRFRLATCLWNSIRAGSAEHMPPDEWRREVDRRKRVSVRRAEQVCEQFPRYLPAARWLAVKKYELHEYQHAVGHVDTALKTFPKDVELLKVGVKSATKEKLWEKAIALSARLAEVEANLPRRWLELADVIVEAIQPGTKVVGKTREWIALFNKAKSRIELIGNDVDKEQIKARVEQLAATISDQVITATGPAVETRPTDTRPSHPQQLEPEKIAALKKAVRRAIEAGTHAEAFRIAAELARTQAPRDIEAHELAADAAFAWGRMDSAVAFCKSGLALDADHLALSLLLARCHATREQWAQAAEALGRVSKTSNKARFRRAFALVRAGNPAAAVEEYATLIVSEPDNFQARYCMTAALAKPNVRDGEERPVQSPRSRIHWTWIVRKYPNLIPARRGLGEALLNGRFERDAIPHFRFITRANLGDAMMLTSEAAGLGLPPVYQFQRAAAKDLRKERIDAWLKLAVCLELGDEHVEAVKAYYEMLKGDSPDIRASNGLCRLFAQIYFSMPRREEMRDRAIEQFRLSLKENPNQPEISKLVKTLEPTN